MAESILLTETGEEMTTEDGENILLEDSPSGEVGTMTVENNLTGDSWATYKYSIKP